MIVYFYFIVRIGRFYVKWVQWVYISADSGSGHLIVAITEFENGSENHLKFNTGSFLLKYLEEKVNWKFLCPWYEVKSRPAQVKFSESTHILFRHRMLEFSGKV